MVSGLVRAATAAILVSLSSPAQVIEFESNGLKYQTITKRGVTVMFAHLPGHVREFSILQVAVSNGSAAPYIIRPEDFSYRRDDGGEMRAWHARDVVELLKEKGGRGDVIKLVSAYETALYGIPHMRVANAYEARRRAALAEVSSTKLKAAAAASAIALVQTKLMPGESTDGAVFFEMEGKSLGPGRLIVRTNTDTFEFQGE
ncbi:MAG TPA: hypothetical protein VMI94_16195 [Bryobacteraceae bacterium]|nr:hypothetical protein [Bryobacteraceae bacterium]